MFEWLFRCRSTAGEFRCCKWRWHRWFGCDMNRWAHCFYDGWHKDCKGSRRWKTYDSTLEGF